MGKELKDDINKRDRSNGPLPRMRRECSPLLYPARWLLQLVAKDCYLQGAHERAEFLRRRAILDFQGSPFDTVLIQFVDNRLLSRLQCTCALSFLLLRLVVSHSLLSTDERFSLFPAILVAQELVGTMGNTPPIWMWCWGHLCCYSLLMDFVHLRVGPWPGFCTSTQNYTPKRKKMS
jgi:hypothetical protein